MLAPEVLRFRAHQFLESEDHVVWRIVHSSVDNFGDRTLLPVIAFLHAGGQGGWAEIEVAALIGGVEEVPESEIPEVLAGSDAIETLYDYARGILSGMLGMVNSGVRLEARAPTAEFERMSDEPDDEDDADAIAESPATK